MIASALVLSGAATAQTDFRHITFDEAKTAAKAENKMIFVDFYTQWCGPCKMLAKKVFPTKEVGDFLNSSYICLKLDAEAEGQTLAKAINVTAYPTLAVFDSEGNLSGKFEGFKEGSAFISAVKEITDPNLKPEVVEQKYLAGDRTPEVVQAYTRQKVESIRNYEKAQEAADEIITDYYNGLTDEQRLSPDNLFIFSTYSNSYASPRFKFLLANIDRFKAMSEEAVDNTLNNAFMMEAIGYLTSNKLSDPATFNEYQSFKSDLAKYGYSEKLAPYLNFAESRKGATDDQYLDYCDKNISSLDDTGVYYLVSSLPDVVDSETPEGRKKIDGFIRRHLAEMDASNIYSSSIVLMQLQKKD